MRNYIDLSTIYSEEEVFGKFKIFKTDSPVASAVIRDFYNSDGSLAKNEQFVLMNMSTEEVLMTDSEMELLSNKHFIDNAKGDILILGLGLGMIVFPLLEDNSINSITIIEKDQEIIDFVGEKINNLDVSKKVKIVCDDAFNYFKNTQDYGMYDYIYIDFWSTITQESVNEMEYLMIQYSPLKKDESSFLRCWTYDIKHIIL